MSEIKGAPCTRCAHFHGRVHVFRRCAPGVCTFFSAIYNCFILGGIGAISGCTVLGEVHPVSAQNKSLILDTVITQDSVQRWDCGVLTFCMYENLLIDQTQRQYSGHNKPLSHRTDHSQWKYHFGNLKQITLEIGWPKTVHPAMEMCTLGAWCILNFRHWHTIVKHLSLYVFRWAYFICLELLQ